MISILTIIRSVWEASIFFVIISWESRISLVGWPGCLNRWGDVQTTGYSTCVAVNNCNIPDSLWGAGTQDFCSHSGHTEQEEIGKKKLERKIHLYSGQRNILNNYYVLKLYYESK